MEIIGALKDVRIPVTLLFLNALGKIHVHVKVYIGLG